MNRVWWLLALAVISACRAWHPMVDRRDDLETRKLHYHTKRHMISTDNDIKRKSTTHKPREMRKKPSGHLAPLDEEDIENDEFVSVAIGPPMRPKANKPHWKTNLKPTPSPPNSTFTNLIKDVLTQLGREFLTHQVNEDFVFGQYVGNSMRNLTGDVKLRMQHDLLDVILKYQKINNGDVPKEDRVVANISGVKKNDTEDGWPDFSNFAKIVG